MDGYDKKILALLQADGNLTVAEIAAAVGLSSTPCWRRIRNLEAEGFIAKRIVLLDAEKINCGVTVFVRLRTRHHDQAWLERFAGAIRNIEEVIEVHRLAGDVDYLLKVMVPSIAGYDSVYKRLIEAIDLDDVSSSFVMETLKETTQLPLGHVG